MPFIVLIETIRRVIRPIAPSVRLAANIIAGHLLIILIRGPLSRFSWLVLIVVVAGLLLLIALELAVSFIQGYVFSTLLSLYIIEVNSPNFTCLALQTKKKRKIDYNSPKKLAVYFSTHTLAKEE